MNRLKAPFPWFGGKSLVSELVWERFGNVDTYNEPFAGSLAVLLGRTHEPKTETVNDLDCYLANFWRSLQADPDGVARYADSPVNEADLHARHRWLVEVARKNAERCLTDPEFYDVKIAGWWVWGQCLWIGSGWCQKPALNLDKKIPHLIDNKGINRNQRRWQGGGAGGGSGVHAPTLARQLPQLSGARSGKQMGLLREGVKSIGLYNYLQQLATRLRRVRVCCGDWQRILTPAVTTSIGTSGIFLDPPYSHDLRDTRCYAEDDHDISSDVCEWAIANGDNSDMRIALCGYAGEHSMPSSWECVPWKANGGYGRTEQAKVNRTEERIWFSPHCLKPDLFSRR
jgi:DNA adenine methylase